MKSSELRVGNYFMFGAMRHKASYHDIANLAKAEQKRITLKMYKPILLNKKWLDKFQFHKDNYGVYELVKDNKPYVSGCKIEFWIKRCKIKGRWVWELCVGDSFDRLELFCHIRYVHQLQNAFHVRSGGKELEEKPQPAENQIVHRIKFV